MGYYSLSPVKKKEYLKNQIKKGRLNFGLPL